MITAKDKTILQELAKSYRDLAFNEVNRERIKRIREIHSLKPSRPPVWIDEIPWHEMDIDGELILHCETKEARNMEQFFRRVLFRWKHLQVDMVVEDAFYINKTYTDSGIGINVKENILSTDTDNNIVSHSYEDQLDTEEKVDKLLIPHIEAQPERDQKNMESALEVLDGILPVKLRGSYITHGPWDEITMLRSVENCFMDMAEKPELIHKTIAKFTEIGLARMEQYEKLGLLDFNISALHCTPPYCDDLPAEDYDGSHVRLKDVWFRGAAQLFASVSPAMLDEYDLHYMKPLMAKCGLVYYGCCEPLDKAIPYLKKIPNLRKIGISPWADVRSSAEQMGRDFVFARKPNPAMVSGVFNREAVEKEISETIEVCLKNNCPYEFVLKDISTVTGRPQNLIDWAKTVMGVIDSYYR